MDVFLPVRFRTQVQLTPSGITSGDIDEHIKTKIRKNLEGICSRFGYIRPGSIEIVKRSLGSLMKAHFNGHIRYDVVCKADVCNPVRGMVFKASVKNKNDLGLLAESGIIVDGKTMPVLAVVIPRRSAGITSELDLDEIDIGDEIYVEVLGKRYQLNDKTIDIIARVVKEPYKKKSRELDREKQIVDEEDVIVGGIDGGYDEDPEDVSYGGTDDENDGDGESQNGDDDDSENDEDDDELDDDEDDEDPHSDGGGDGGDDGETADIGDDDF